LNQPTGVALDSMGNLYIADQGNNVVRKVIPATGTITTIAGNGSLGFMGDGGPGTDAELARPFGVETVPGGRIYVADTSANRIRVLPAPPLPPPPVVSPNFTSGLSVPSGVTTVLSYRISNPAADQAAHKIRFNSALSSGLVVAAPNGSGGSCGTITAVEGSRSVAVSGVDLGPGGTCTAAINVTAGCGRLICYRRRSRERRTTRQLLRPHRHNGRGHGRCLRQRFVQTGDGYAERDFDLLRAGGLFAE